MADELLDFPPCRVVAIDTSSADGSVAAVGGGVEVVERLPIANEHARDVASAVVAVVRRAGWTLDTVSCIAAVRGPGSFTGLRVGVTTAKALAWAIPTKLVGVSAFEGIARQLRRMARPLCSGDLAIAFDAGRGEVHACTARLDGDAVVGGGDLAVLLAGWGGPSPDLDGDGVVGGSDLAVLLSSWGEACGP